MTRFNIRFFSPLLKNGTLGARDFSSAVSGFCQVLIVTRGFGLRPKMCRPSGNTENSHGTREKPLVPRVKKMDTPAGKLYCTFCITRKVSMVMFINPLSPKSDQHQISPYDIST